MLGICNYYALEISSISWVGAFLGLLLNSWHPKGNMWSPFGCSCFTGWSDVILPGPSMSRLLLTCREPPSVVLSSLLLTGQRPAVPISSSHSGLIAGGQKGVRVGRGESNLGPKQVKVLNLSQVLSQVQHLGCLGFERKLLDFG